MDFEPANRCDDVDVRWLRLSSLLVVGMLVACGHGSHESLVLDRSIGVVRLKESRARIEQDIGKGRLVSSKLDRSARPEPLREEQVAYEKPNLVVWYLSDRHHTPSAVVLKTTSSRYRTKSGIGVGASFTQLRKVGVNCHDTNCQHFQGHNKPGTLFRLTAPRGRVAQIYVIASVD